VYQADGLLHAPLGSDVTIENVLWPGETVTIPHTLRSKLAEMEVINSHEQLAFEKCDPVQNLWFFYQHVTVLPLLSPRAQQTIAVLKQRSLGATCSQIYAGEWGTDKFNVHDMPEVWHRNLAMFAPHGRYIKVEQLLKRLGDVNGDGSFDWRQFVAYMGTSFGKE